MVTAQPGPMLSDVILSSPILMGESGAPLAQGGQGFESFGIDPTEDPELAMVSHCKLKAGLQYCTDCWVMRCIALHQLAIWNATSGLPLKSVQTFLETLDKFWPEIGGFGWTFVNNYFYRILSCVLLCYNKPCNMMAGIELISIPA